MIWVVPTLTFATLAVLVAFIGWVGLSVSRELRTERLRRAGAARVLAKARAGVLDDEVLEHVSRSCGISVEELRRMATDAGKTQRDDHGR